MYYNLRIADNTKLFEEVDNKGYYAGVAECIKSMISMGVTDAINISTETRLEEAGDMVYVLADNIEQKYKYITSAERETASQLIEAVNKGIDPLFYKDHFDKYYIKFDVDRWPKEKNLLTPELEEKLETLEALIPAAREYRERFAHLFAVIDNFDEDVIKQIAELDVDETGELATLNYYVDRDGTYVLKGFDNSDEDFEKLHKLYENDIAKSALVELYFANGYDIDFLKNALKEYTFKYRDFNEFKEFLKDIKDATKEEIELVKEYMITQEYTSLEDASKLISANRWGYDARQLINIKEIDFGISLMNYQKKHPEYNVEISDFIRADGYRNSAADAWEYDSYDGDYDDITDLVLSSDVNIYKLAGLTFEQTKQFMELYSQGFDMKTLYAAGDLAIKYNKEHPNTNIDVATVARMIEGGMLTPQVVNRVEPDLGDER